MFFVSHQTLPSNPALFFTTKEDCVDVSDDRRVPSKKRKAILKPQEGTGMSDLDFLVRVAVAMRGEGSKTKRRRVGGDDVEIALRRHKIVPVGGIPNKKDVAKRDQIPPGEIGKRYIYHIKPRRVDKFYVFREPITLVLRIVSCLYYTKSGEPEQCLMYIVDSLYNQATLPCGERGKWAFTSLRQLYLYTAFVVSGVCPDMKNVKNNNEAYMYNSLYTMHGAKVFSATPETVDYKSSFGAPCNTLEMQFSLLSEMVSNSIEEVLRSRANKRVTADPQHSSPSGDHTLPNIIRSPVP